MRVEVRDLVLTARAWLVAVSVWLVVTVACTFYTTAKLTSFTAAIHVDHELLMKFEVQGRSASFDRDIELRKRLITLQDGLVQLQAQQLENIKKIEVLQQFLNAKRKKETR